MPDQGKSQLSCDIAARITTTSGDKDWPCKEGKAPSGNVIIFSAEDDASDTLNPRLAAAGADLTRIKYVKMNVMLRISDSLAFVAAARAVYAVIPDDENQRRLLVRGKNNLAPAASDKTLAYSCTVADVVIPDFHSSAIASIRCSRLIDPARDPRRDPKRE
jgi:hypothetical protein